MVQIRKNIIPTSILLRLQFTHDEKNSLWSNPTRTDFHILGLIFRVHSRTANYAVGLLPYRQLDAGIVQH